MRSKSACCLSPCSLLLVVLGLLACGCGPAETDTHFDITYDPCAPLVVEPQNELRAEELAAVDDALEMWNQAGPLKLTRQPIADAPRLRVRFEKGAPFVNGYYSDETGEVTINRNLADHRERTITLAHEMGHAFGLRHVARSKRRSLMNSGNLQTMVTDSDVEHVLSRWESCDQQR